MQHLLFFIISLILAFPASAGSRNGYRLVFFDDSPIRDQENLKLFNDYFNANLPPNIYRCDENNRFIDIDIVYIHRRPKAITPELIRSSLQSDKKALKKLRTALRNFRNAEIDYGFDGLIVFRHDEGNYQLATIGAAQNGYQRIARLRNNSGKLTPESLKKLFCDSTAELDFAYQSK